MQVDNLQQDPVLAALKLGVAFSGVEVAGRSKKMN